ncbi:MAG: MarR family transcriptional regulator [Syntrophaceae bacterium]|jgi:DNA-binding MarR family transcriptional regulator
MQKARPIGYMLAQTMRVYKNMITATLKENKYGLSFEQYVMMMILSMEKGPTQQDLANQLQKDKSSILRHTDVLIKKQYVGRVPDKNDKRMKKLYLTTSGTEMIIRLKALAREVEGRLLHGINAAEVNTFMDVLGKIHTNGGLEDEFCCLQENNQNDNIQNENN